MDFRNCLLCHKPFQYSGYGPVYCPMCVKKDSEEFDTVRQYLEKNPGAQGQDVFLATKVPISTISRWIREERLVTANAVNVGVVCEKCGTPIYKGKLCENCKKSLAKEVLNSYSEETRKQILAKHDSMRFL